MAFKFTGEEKYAGAAHFFAQPGGVKMVEKYDVVAVEIFRQFFAGMLLFSHAGEAEFAGWMLSGLTDDEVRAFVFAKRSGE